MKIVAVSDTSIGYGSKQIPSFVEYLCDFYGTNGIIIEPDQIERPPQNHLYEKITIKRVIGVFHPYHPAGHIDYIIKATKIIEEIKPDILIICSSFTLPVLFKIKFRPKKIIYYCLEMPDNSEEILELNKNIESKVDLIVFPEENRASIFLESTNIRLPICIVYNSTNKGPSADILPSHQRNGKIIYHGGIHKETAYKYFLDKKIQRLPIDMYGIFESPIVGEKEKIASQFFSLSGNVKYIGYVSADKLEEIRKPYMYSIVIWLPTTLNTKFACPNKFFESISNGVPPITAPHPQTKMLCDRYGCGIVMEDFDFNSFLNSIKLAMELNENEYAELVENCRKAVQTELYWEKQMDKVTRILDRD